MAKSAAIRVDGAKQLRKKLTELGDDLDELKAAHKRIADQGAELVLARLPRRTGKLASSVRGAGTKTSASIRWGRKSVPYAGAIEFGGYPEGVPFVKEGKHVYPAIQDFAPKAKDIYEAEVRKLIARL